MHLPVIDNISGADLSDMQLLSKFKIKEIHYLLRVIDIFSKYAWVVPFKEKIGATITDTFQKMFKWILTETKQNMGW